MGNSTLLHAAMRHRGISPTERLVLVALSKFSDKHGEAQVPQSALADMLEVSPRTVRKALQSLEAKDLVTRKPSWSSTGGRKTDRITSHTGVPDNVVVLRPQYGRNS